MESAVPFRGSTTLNRPQNVGSQAPERRPKPPPKVQVFTGQGCAGGEPQGRGFCAPVRYRHWQRYRACRHGIQLDFLQPISNCTKPSSRPTAPVAGGIGQFWFVADYWIEFTDTTAGSVQHALSASANPADWPLQEARWTLRFPRHWSAPPDQRNGHSSCAGNTRSEGGPFCQRYPMLAPSLIWSRSWLCPRCGRDADHRAGMTNTRPISFTCLPDPS